jgi:hypothetical protein
MLLSYRDGMRGWIGRKGSLGLADTTRAVDIEAALQPCHRRISDPSGGTGEKRGKPIQAAGSRAVPPIQAEPAPEASISSNVGQGTGERGHACEDPLTPQEARMIHAVDATPVMRPDADIAPMAGLGAGRAIVRGETRLGRLPARWSWEPWRCLW